MTNKQLTPQQLSCLKYGPRCECSLKECLSGPCHYDQQENSNKEKDLMIDVISKRITDVIKEIVSNEISKLAEIERQKADILFDVKVHNAITNYNRGGK